MAKQTRRISAPAMIALIVWTGGAAAAADETMQIPAQDYGLRNAPAMFRWEPSDPAEAPAAPPEFGAAGSKWWTVGVAGADNFQDAVDLNIHGAYSYFLARDVEAAFEAAAWHFNQPGDNAFGGSGSLVLRWHFVNTGDWTVYADAGIGLLLASDDVPPDGTSFDFLPRAGVGFTRKLTDDGLRLQMGVRWHHISNARITSDEDNPGRDAAMVYAGLIFPF